LKARIIRYLKKKILLAAGGQKGVTLIETLVALALLGIFGVAFLSAISTSAITMASTQRNVDVEGLARAQMEYTKNCNYDPHDYGPPEIPPDYTTLDELVPGNPYAIVIPTGYSINVTATALDLSSDTGIQKITVTVSKDGGALLVMEGYKVNR